MVGSAGGEQALQQLRRARAGVGHVDVRIGAVGDQRIGALQHALRDVGMQVQAGDDRHVRAHRRTQPGQQFAFAVVVLVGHHRAVQVQIDRVGPLCARGVHDLAGDALERIGGHMRRRAGAGPDHRQQFRLVAGQFADRADEAARRDIDVAQRQHVGAAHHRGKALAADKVVVVGLGRREGIGFVLETGEKNAHGSVVVEFGLGKRGRRRQAGRGTHPRAPAHFSAPRRARGPSAAGSAGSPGRRRPAAPPSPAARLRANRSGP